MPKTELHKQKRTKNWLLFFILLTLAGIFFWLTILKMGGQA